MSRHEEMCPHCRAKAGLDGGTVLEIEPIAVPELPDEPRVFRIYYPAEHAWDYTLHPDGRLTFAIGSELLTTSLSFADMVEMAWEGAHIEWDPQEPAATVTPMRGRPETVQDSLELPAA